MLGTFAFLNNKAQKRTIKRESTARARQEKAGEGRGRQGRAGEWRGEKVRKGNQR